MTDLEKIRHDLGLINALDDSSNLKGSELSGLGWKDVDLNFDSELALNDLILESADRLTVPDLEGNFGLLEKNIEALAWYIPFHFDPHNSGIFITTNGVQQLATNFARALRDLRKAESISQEDWAWCIALAIESLLSHEMFHHQFEVALTRLELMTSKPLYASSRRAGPKTPLRLLEEGVATSRMVHPPMRNTSATVPKELRRAQRIGMKKVIPCLGEGYKTGRDYLGKERFQRAQRELIHMAQGVGEKFSETGNMHTSVVYGEIVEVAKGFHIRYDSSEFAEELRSIATSFKPVKRTKIVKLFQSLGASESHGREQTVYRLPGIQRPFPLPDSGKEVEGRALKTLATILGVKLVDLSKTIDSVLDGTKDVKLPIPN